MLYRKNIIEIRFDDVVSFCEQSIKENERLDYKGDFPNRLENTISSMANSHGGIIVIGINDDDGRPKKPFSGIEFSRGLSERITQIDISNIYPPVFPEIQVCPPVDNMTFIIIRISESNSAPHYVRDKKEVYIRTGNINTPEEIANIDELEWLRDKRKASILLREQLVKNTYDHFSNIEQAYSNYFINSSVLSLIICPLYPSKILLEYDEIDQLRNEYEFKNLLFSVNQDYSELPTQNGKTFFPMDNRFDLIEINQFGLLSKKTRLIWQKREKTEDKIENDVTTPKYYINYGKIVSYIRDFTLYSKEFFNKIGYWGYLSLNLSISNIFTISLDRMIDGDLVLTKGLSIIKSFNLPEYYEIISIYNLNDESFRNKYVLSICNNICHAFGAEIDPTKERIVLNKC